MSVQLLLLQKSIYWSWVYCKITKVRSWIHLLSRALLLLPSNVWGETCPAHPCSLPPPHHGSSPGTNQTSLPAPPEPLSLHLSKETKSPTWKNKVWKNSRKWPISSGRGFGCLRSPSGAAVWDGGAGYGWGKGLLKGSCVWKHSCGLHVGTICWNIYYFACAKEYCHVVLVIPMVKIIK